MFKATKEIDGELKEVILDNELHVAAFEKDDWDIEEVTDEPKNKGGRPRKEE